MKPKKRRSLIGPVGVALLVFLAGCGLIVLGVFQDENWKILLGGILIIGAGGIAALMGDAISEDFILSQGGGAAKRAREKAEHDADTTGSDLTVPEDWHEHRRPGP